METVPEMTALTPAALPVARGLGELAQRKAQVEGADRKKCDGILVTTH